MREKNYHRSHIEYLQIAVEQSYAMKQMLADQKYMIEKLMSSSQITEFDLADNILANDPNRGVKLAEQVGIL